MCVNCNGPGLSLVDWSLQSIATPPSSQRTAVYLGPGPNEVIASTVTTRYKTPAHEVDGAGLGKMESEKRLLHDATATAKVKLNANSLVENSYNNIKGQTNYTSFIILLIQCHWHYTCHHKFGSAAAPSSWRLYITLVVDLYLGLYWFGILKEDMFGSFSLWKIERFRRRLNPRPWMYGSNRYTNYSNSHICETISSFLVSRGSECFYVPFSDLFVALRLQAQTSNMSCFRKSSEMHGSDQFLTYV